MATKNSNIVRLLLKRVGAFAEELINNEDQRIQNKEQIAQRMLQNNLKSTRADSMYSAENAVIANLDWGIEAIEEAINARSNSMKVARLDHAEKMLQVCALLDVRDPDNNTAGVPNCYLAAWARLNLALVFKLRSNDKACCLQILEMFMADPLHSRIELAPTLWEDLFLGYLNGVLIWYGEERSRILESVLPDDVFGVSVCSQGFLAFDDVGCKALLSKMSEKQAKELQALERVYQEVLDENTRICASFYEDWLEFDGQKMGMQPGNLPGIQVPGIQGQFRSKTGFGEELNAVFDGGTRLKRIDEAEFAMNGRYNPMWEEDYDDQSMHCNIRLVSASFKLRSKAITQRVAAQDMLIRMTSNLTTTGEEMSSKSDDDPDHRGLSYSFEDSSSSFESAPKFKEEIQERVTSSSFDNEENEDDEDFDGDNRSPMPKESPIAGSEEDASQSSHLVPSSGTSTPPQQRPPKDFVCPITGQLFKDPVTLETGQTYERRAIQEWLTQGKSTCPITRQKLENIALPQTNYLLKRLIAAWREENPELAVEFSDNPKPGLAPAPSRTYETSSVGSDTPSSPNYTENQSNSENERQRNGTKQVTTSTKGVGNQAAIESMTIELRPAISCLCTSEDLQGCESAVMTIARVWQNTKAASNIQNQLLKPTLINGLVEILSNSMTTQVLRAAVYILSELVAADTTAIQTLTRVDSDFQVFVALLKKGLWEAAVLIYQLKPSFSYLASLDLVPVLVQVMIDSKEKELESDFQMQMRPKDVAMVLLERILSIEHENNSSAHARDIISMNGIPALLSSLESKNMEERCSAISILLSCIHADGRCRNSIANRAELVPILELLRSGIDRDRITAINFISELIRVNRRTFNEQVLRIIKEEGAFSTMHMLLVHLQMASMEQRPNVATLLLQIDLLEEPRKMSMYREEALEALVEGLKSEEFLVCRVSAAETIVSLQGRFSLSGKPLTEALLLKNAGLDKSYNAMMKADQDLDRVEESLESLEEEEKAAKVWERRVASVLVSYEFGLLFEALGECLQSKSVQLTRPALVASTWLTHMLTILPDTGVRGAARQCLLERFVTILKSHKRLEDRALAALGLRTFISDSEGLQELELHAKDIYEPLRELKKASSAETTSPATDILRAFASHPFVNVSELWKYEELSLKDTSTSGELNCLVHAGGRIFSGHSDGSLKAWDCRKKILSLIQEVREHTKSVTSLAVSSSGEKLYSGSHDKTIRIWFIGTQKIQCMQVHEVKDHVLAFNVNSSFACFIPQGAGIKIYEWSGSSKIVNSSKHARCLTMAQGKVYCGCTDNSIQEIDLETGMSISLQSGVRKLLGKATPIYALQVYGGFLYVACCSTDGVTVKVWSLATKSVVGSLSTSLEIRCMAVTNEFLYLGSKFGAIEVWLRDRLMKVGTLYTKGNSKLVSLAVHMDGELLFCGSLEGKIQAWGLA